MAFRKSRVLLLGSGGVGTIAALNLEIGGLAEVTSVLRSNYAVVSLRGFTIKSCEHGEIQNWRPTEILNSVPSVADSATIQPFDYVVCCTKNVPDVTPTACEIIAPAISPGHTVIVLVQNGLNIEKPFLRRFPSNIVLSGVSRIDAHEVAPGVIEQRQKDILYVGAFENCLLPHEEQQKAAQHFANIYSAGLKTTCSYEPNVRYDRWVKLVNNASFNPICALTRLTTGELQRKSRTVDNLLIPAMKEIISAAEAAGYSLPEDIIKQTMQSNPPDENISPSMLVDIQKGNFIEHENILGEVLREARKSEGVATPILSTLYELCCMVQWRTKKGMGRPEPGV
ncbi:hypothetical protein ASPBRDRAFT_678566 [Aspergillus brasiliensis CBS 101740]|uniref:2-dehydropantoate 2-reductase n=1 Tax=Aspergillus brasiliensis (strain CBS 101740 / IMI 381727 / IBT 21946) TaxID=767769 RepID=A0A1L9UEF1_ASPBC|nr:hypothetical protein ASPBRDRAFT_678566 [Aspergillus brasiliensis CBS 101740]